MTERLSGVEGPGLRAVIVAQQYCLGQPDRIPLESQRPDTLTLALQVRLYYTNPGVRPVIVPKLENVAIILSHNLEDAQRRRNQLVVPPRFRRMLNDLEWQGLDLSLPDGKQFTLIQPESEVEGMTENASFLVHEAGNPRSDWIGKEVFIQLEVDHLVIPTTLATELRAKWGHVGTLWTGTARTQPIRFRIPSSPKASPCPSRYHLD